MWKKIDSEKTGRIAGQCFDEQYHCAESIVTAVMKVSSEDNPDITAHATAFGGGFGRTFTEACGVVSGGLLIIGHYHGRRSPDESWDLPAELGARFREEFIKRHETCNCMALRERFGEEQQMSECRKLIVEGTTSLVELLQEQQETELTQ